MEDASGRHSRLLSVFAQVIETPPPEREALARSLCGGDEELLAEVTRLLEYDSSTGPIGERSPWAHRLSGSVDEELPDQIADFRVLRLIGEGGMGRVFEAEQASPRRRVALKVIRPTNAVPSEMRRFAREADLLARLHHPGIARIFAAGTAQTAGGPRPYLAMELVHGESLLRYAEHQHLDVPQRLELMARICDAVEHAHQRGVLHRDLKPANILVDQDGDPRVLDFGIGRAIDAASTQHTQAGQLMGTVRYMSPEQAAGDPDDMDTRSDVYALGVIAYELLCGHHPIDLEDTALLTALHAVREGHVVPLSRRSPDIPRDVATIVHTAIAQDRTRRYASCGAMATDIRRYLDREPILARTPSAIYQVGLFARRNRLLVGGAVAFVVALMTSLIALANQAKKARDALVAETKARQLAEQESRRNLAVGDLFRRGLGTRDGLSGNKEQTVREWLDNTSASLLEEVANDAATQAFLHALIGELYLSVSSYPQSIRHYEAALAQNRALLPPHSIEVIDNMVDLGNVYLTLGRVDDSLRLLLEAAEFVPRGPDALSTASKVHLTLSEALRADGQPTRAAAVAQQAVAEHREFLEMAETSSERLRRTRSLVVALTAAAVIELDSVNYAAAEPICREALEVAESCCDPLDPHIGQAANNLASAMLGLRRFEEAVELLTRALAIYDESLNPDHSARAGVLYNLGSAQYMTGDYEEALQNYTLAYEITRTALGVEHPRSLKIRQSLAYCLEHVGRGADALPELEAILEQRRRAGDEDFGEISYIAAHTITLRRRLGRDEGGAETSAEIAAAVLDMPNQEGAEPQDLSILHREVAEALDRRGDVAGATRAWEQCYQQLERTKCKPTTLEETLQTLTEHLNALDRDAESVPYHERLYHRLVDAATVPESADRVGARLVELLRRLGRHEDAARMESNLGAPPDETETDASE